MPPTDPAKSAASAPPSAERLPRRYTTVTATSVVVASMIGTGIFTTTGLMLAQVESALVVLVCWVLAAAVSLAGALSYAELAAMMPEAGGEYVYLREAYGPLWAFLNGWISFFVGFSAPIAATAVAVSAYLGQAGVPAAEGKIGQKAVALAAVLLLSAVHYRGGAVGAGIQNLLTGAKLLLIAVLVALGFALGRGSWHFLAVESRSWHTAHWSQIGVALLWASFAYSGWNASAYLAEDVREPQRVLPRSLVAGTLVVSCLYLSLNLLYLYAAPSSALRGVVPVAATATRMLFGRAPGAWLAALLGVVLLASLGAYVMTGPRVYLAMARDRLFFPFAARLHPVFRTPALAIVAQAACACLMVLLGSFEQLLTYIAFSLGVFMWMAVAAVIVLRRRQPERDRPHRVRGYPYVPLAYLAIMCIVLVVGFVNSPGPSSVGLATILAGIPVYRLMARRVLN